MDSASIGAQLDVLISSARGPGGLELQNRIHQGTLSVMHVLYGPNSSQERDLRASLDKLTKSVSFDSGSAINGSMAVLRGTLGSMKSEVAAGFVGSLRGTITADLLSDLIKLARAALDGDGDGAKSVASVLAAAAFEDTLRRLAELNGLPPQESLASTLESLKQAAVMKGAQVGVAQSYLSFRNRALHAKWAEVDRPETQSVLAFVEALLVKHFA